MQSHHCWAPKTWSNGKIEQKNSVISDKIEFLFSRFSFVIRKNLNKCFFLFISFVIALTMSFGGGSRTVVAVTRHTHTLTHNQHIVLFSFPISLLFKHNNNCCSRRVFMCLQQVLSIVFALTTLFSGVEILKKSAGEGGRESEKRKEMEERIKISSQ